MAMMLTMLSVFLAVGWTCRRVGPALQWALAGATLAVLALARLSF
jgi:hypothetical protein